MIKTPTLSVPPSSTKAAQRVEGHAWKAPRPPEIQPTPQQPAASPPAPGTRVGDTVAFVTKGNSHKTLFKWPTSEHMTRNHRFCPAGEFLQSGKVFLKVYLKITFGNIYLFAFVEL